MSTRGWRSRARILIVICFSLVCNIIILSIMALEFIKKALKTGRSVSLPADHNEAFYVLLPYVVQNQIRPVVELITNSNFPVNHVCGRAQRTLLHSAANTGAIDSVTFLIKRGAMVNVQDKIGVTPLHLAARNGHKKCVQKLFDNGADISIHDNEGLTALHWLACNGRTELLVSILQRGENPDVIDIHGHTALHVSCQNGHYQCMIQLLEYQADINRINKEGRTPLFFACRHGQMKCVKFLLMKDASMIPDNDGVYPLDVCVEGGYKECVEIILMKYPNELDRLIWLVKQDAIPFDKLQSVLEYLCHTNVALMIGMMSKLTYATSTIGMELLSISSSYQDVMPQFIRCIKALCFLYPRYQSIQQQYQGAPSHDRGSPSISESPRTTRAATFSLFSSHRRTGSQGNQLDPVITQTERESMITGSMRRGKDTSSPVFPPDPLSDLEVVWTSLCSWFDLLKNEVMKLGDGQTPITDHTPATDHTPTVDSDNISMGSSQLAAAIILSAPPRRREVFLRNCSTGTNTPEEVNFDSKEFKRRSWHVERFARVIALEEDEQEFASLPSYQRSISTEQSGSSGDVLPVQEEQLSSGTSDFDIVGAYADRLSAVTHAFSLCSKVTGESVIHTRFMDFVNNYESVLKVLLARCPRLIFAHFHFLLEHNDLLRRFIHIVHSQPFEDRKKWFFENLYGDNPPDQQLALTQENNEIIVNRESIFDTSCTKIIDAPIDKLKNNFAVRFEGEAGMGAGVHREWFNNLSAEILNPDYALFTQSADGATFQPNSHSDVNPDHLSYFKFAGRTMSLAVYHKQLLNVYFTRSFYKHILGIPVSYKDVESIDPEYANNLQWLLDNDINSLDLGLTFSVETDVFGATKLIELKPNGNEIIVTDDNKSDYVQLVTEMRMTQAIGPQIEAFTEGFYEIIPHHLISLFDEYELELLMSGLPDIDVNDWEANTDYNGYNTDNDIIKWFWEIVRDFDKKELAILLQFVTGSSRVPLGGFVNLVGASGLTKFTISRLDYIPNRLPMASTCFNLLKLPDYPTKDILKDRLHLAMTCGTSLIDIT